MSKSEFNQFGQGRGRAVDVGVAARLHKAGWRDPAALRQRATLTQQELAKRLEKSQSFVSDYERGKRRIDVVEFLVVARTLGVDPLDIVREILASIPEPESTGVPDASNN